MIRYQFCIQILITSNNNTILKNLFSPSPPHTIVHTRTTKTLLKISSDCYLLVILLKVLLNKLLVDSNVVFNLIIEVLDVPQNTEVDIQMVYIINNHISQW